MYVIIFFGVYKCIKKTVNKISHFICPPGYGETNGSKAKEDEESALHER